MAKRIKKTETCLNCGTHQGDANYCPNCGQFNNSKKPNVLELIREALENLFAFDSRFYKTLGPLLFRPGRLTINYVEGKKSRYVLPIRLFIISIFLLLAVISCNNSIDKERWYEVDRPQLENEGASLLSSVVHLNVDTSGISPAKLDSLIENDWIILDTASSRFLVNPNKGYSNTVNWYFGDSRFSEFYQYSYNHKLQPVDDALEELNFEPTFTNHLLYSTALKISLMKGDDFMNYISSNVLIILLLFIPIIALVMKGLYIYKGIYYVDHFVFATHIQTALSLYMSLLIMSYWILQSEVLYLVYYLGIMTYIFLAIKRFYRQNWFITFIKFSILNIVLFIVTIIFILLVATVSVILY
ncbi:MAG: DUF3667 domain-containing protein [Bacteroidetes bacterium]|nr:MAG: DUF3667 domain-containing protein [Bacteroidota bacterium]